MSFEGISPKSIGQTSSVMTKPMSASSMISRILDFGLAKSNGVYEHRAFSNPRRAMTHKDVRFMQHPT